MDDNTLALCKRIETLTNVIIAQKLDRREQIELQKQQLEISKQILALLSKQPSFKEEIHKRFK